MDIKNVYLEKLRQAVPIFGSKLWNEIPGIIDGRYVKKIVQTKISVVFEILKEKDDYVDATMITRELKSRNPKP